MSTNSIKSDALEPTRAEMKNASAVERLLRRLPVYGLPILTVFLIVLFSLILPETFPTLLNVRSIVSDKAIIAMLSLAAMVPMAAGKIDLTVGYGIVLWHILAISLQTMFGVPWQVAVLAVVLLGAIVGLLNGVLVEVARIDSFIATLGTGTVLYAIALWHSGGRQVVGVLPQGFLALNGTMIFGLPITGFYVLALAVADVARARASADRPLPLCDWRQPQGGGAERHPGATLHYGRVPCFGNPYGGRGRAARL